MSANQTRLGRSAIKFWASRFGATGRESLLSVVHISRRRQLPERCRGRSGARQQVVAVASEHAKADGTDAKWTGNVPNEPGKWTGTNPILRMAGTWLRRTGMADGGSPDDRTPPAPMATRTATSCCPSACSNCCAPPHSEREARFGQIWLISCPPALVRARSRQVLAGRAGVMILLGVVDEVPPGEEAALGAARCQCLWHTGQHAGG